MNPDQSATVNDRFEIAFSNMVPDSDGDGVPDASDICNGFDDNADNDNDNVPDGCDLDDDNDGILDSNEERCDQPTYANPDDSGSGSYQDQLYIFDWSGIGGSLSEGDSQTFTINNLVVTATFSNVVINGAGASVSTFDLQTWSQAIIGQLYNTAGSSESLYGNANTTSFSFRVNFTATKNGIPYPLDIIAIDSESTSAAGGESISFSTNGGSWTFLEGLNTNGNPTLGEFNNTGSTLNVVDTFDFGEGNSLYYSTNATEIDVNLSSSGTQQQAVAFGIWLYCDTDGDGTLDYLDLDSDNDGCFDALEGGDNILAGAVDGSGMLTGTPDPTTGVPNNVDVNNGQTAGTSTDDAAFDSFGQCDQDGDGVIDANDVCNGFDDTADNDTDGVPDGCDLDDDNDGILDTVENPCGTQVTNAWTGSGDTFTGTGAANNATVSFTHGPNSEITYSPTGTHNSLALWSNPSVENNTSFEMLFVWDTNPEALSSNAADDADTATMTITYAQPVLNPIIHIERLGGSGRSGSIYLSNSTEFTLVTPGLSMNKLSGNNQLIVESNKFYRAPFLNLGSANPGGGSDLTSTSTGAGSIQVNGVVTTVTFSLTGIGVEGTGRDGIEFSFEACTAIDTDNDGIPDYLDLDSDGDGCPDAIEGGGTFTPADLVTSAIDGGNNNDGSTTGTYTGTVTDSVQLNLGASSNDDGTPNLDGNTATSESQATAPAVTDSGTNACVADLNLIKTVNNALPKIGDTIVYTLTVKNDGAANATGVQVTDVLPTGITYVSHTVSTTGTTFTDSDADVIRDLWNIGDMAVNQTISLQITGTVSGAGTIVNTAEITQSNPLDEDSTPDNGN